MYTYCSVFILIVHFATYAQPSALKVADSLYANGNYTKAITIYKTHENPDEVYDKIAKSYLAIGNLALALENYQQSVEANPDDALLQLEYAKLLQRTKKYKEASEVCNGLINRDYRNPHYHYQMGLALEKLQDSTSHNRFMSAYELDNNHQKAIFKIAKHYLQKRRHQLSHQYIDKGLESYAGNVELVSLKAQNYYHQQYYDKAIIWFIKLLELGESSEFIHEKLSICYAEYSEYEKALKHRLEQLKYNPYDTVSMYVIGTYYEQLNDFEKAEEYISKSLKLQDVPLNQEYKTLGSIYNRQKKYDEALKAFQKALKEDPTDVFTRFYTIRTKDEYYADREAVIKLYEDFIKNHRDNPFARFAEIRLKELKDESFLKKD